MASGVNRLGSVRGTHRLAGTAGGGADVNPGNTADPSTLPDQVNKLKQRFGLERVILVGDRGILTQTQIEALKQYPGRQVGSPPCGARSCVSWWSNSLCKCRCSTGKNLAEIHSPEFPGERLIVCFNPMLAEERQRKRQALLEANELALEKLVKQVRRRTKTPLSAAEIGRKVGNIIPRFKVAKHFESKLPHRGWAIQLPAANRGDPTRDRAGRNLCHSHQRARTEPVRRRHGAQL
ncbi:MAG: hypothetical protein ACRERU_16990 [Methylococcales bacterium]